MELVFVGAGRLATNFARTLCGQGHRVCAVYSRTLASASALTDAVGGFPTDDIAVLPKSADAYILAVKDDILPTLIPQLRKDREGQAFFHTAGSVPLTVFGNHACCGVIYPLQTFSKERMVDFSRVHIFIEGQTPHALSIARQIASSVSQHVTELSSPDRRQLHLAAVFACNFSNHCYTLAADILQRCGLGFDALLPLVEETACKVKAMHPRQAQTGPAMRYDRTVIDAQSQLLADEPLTQKIYELMSKSIHQHCSE